MQLTPNEILNLFPITKDFDGWKYECKDYFYTVEKLNEYNPDSPLGNRLEDFLWDYVNDYTGDFIIDMMSTASDLRKFQGKPCFLEEWAEQNGISTLTVNERDGYIMDNQTNRTMPYHKPIPEYMTVVKQKTDYKERRKQYLKIEDIKIDPELRDLLPPLTKDEFQDLENGILKNGLQDTIKVWTDEETDITYLVDGHNRYNICKKNKIDLGHWQIQELGSYRYKNKDDIIKYMLDTQLGRRNLSPVQRYVIAEKYKTVFEEQAKKNMSAGGKGLTTLSKVNTRKELANVVGVSEGTYAKLNKIFESDNDEVKSKLKSNEMSINAAYNEIKPDRTDDYNNPEFEIDITKIYEIDIDKLKPLPQWNKYFKNITGRDWINFLESVETNGILNPIIISQNNIIISGHQRVRACKELEIEKIPCIYKLYIDSQHISKENKMLKDCLTCNLKLNSNDFEIAFNGLKEYGWTE